MKPDDLRYWLGWTLELAGVALRISSKRQCTRFQRPPRVTVVAAVTWWALMTALGILALINARRRGRSGL